MVDLLELPERVGIEVAVARQKVQLAQELRRLVREELATDRLAFDLASQTETTSTTSGTSSRSRDSMPIFSVIVEEGQPEQEPCMVR